MTVVARSLFRIYRPVALWFWSVITVAVDALSHGDPRGRCYVSFGVLVAVFRGREQGLRQCQRVTDPGDPFL